MMRIGTPWWQLRVFLVGMCVVALVGCGATAGPTTTTLQTPLVSPAVSPGGSPAVLPPGSPAAQTPAGGAVQLQFWHGQSQSQQTALNGLVDQFNASHPDIQVTATYQGNYSDLYNKVTAAIAAGTPPDLAIAYQNDVSNYLKSDAVIPLDNLMSDPQVGFSQQDLADIFPTFIDHYPQAGNQVYSIAFMRSMQVMFYNAGMLKAAGIQNPPQNWSDFLAACAAVSKPPDVYCYEMTPDASTFANMVWSSGGDLISADQKSVAFSSTAGLDTLKLINHIFRNQQAILTSRAFQDQTDFALGKIAFTFGSSAGLPYYTQAISQSGQVSDWSIAPTPYSTTNPVVDLYGPSVAIFKTTPEKERAAFIFLKWMMDPGPNATWIRATEYFPARQSTLQSLNDYIKANPLYDKAITWLPYGRTEPTTAAWNPIRNDIADAMTAVANESQSPAAAMSDLVQKANAELAAP